MSPSQTAARVDIFMIAVLPQTGQRHRNANGEAAAGSQSQRVSVWFIRDTLVMVQNVGRTKPRLHLREQRFCAAKVCNRQHQPDPGWEIPPWSESLRISDAGDRSGSV